MKDASRLVESSGRGLGSRLDRAWSSIFIFLALALFGIGVAALTLSLVRGLSQLASSIVGLLLIFLPFRKVFTKQSRTFTVAAILFGALFTLVLSFKN